VKDPRDSDPAPILANIDAEAALLGALMIDNRLIADIGHVLTPADFYEPLFGRIYRTLVVFFEAGKVANPVTLRPIFEMDRTMKELGGPAYLAQLTGSGAAVIGARDFAAQIRDLARLRDVRDAVDRGLERIGESASLEEFLAEVEIATAKASITMRSVPLLTTEQMIDLTAARVDKSLAEGVPGASCALVKDVDTLIGKLEPGQYTILAGRPGMGKSTAAMSMALGYALNGHPGLYALAESSHEMFSVKLTADLLHAAGRKILFRTLRQGILSNTERRDLATAREVAESLPIKFAHIGRSDVKRLEAIASREAMRLKREGRKLEYVIIDYLQLLTADGRHRVGDNIGRINAVSEALLGIAQRLDTHVIGLSQLNRALEARPDKRPHLADLRDSGRLEEDADNVVFVFREEYYLEKAKPAGAKDLEAWEIDMIACRDKIEFIAAKTRFSANATRKCQFLGDYSAVRGSAYVPTDPFADDDDDDLFARFGKAEG
jgi:replicative DNA helicase